MDSTPQPPQLPSLGECLGPKVRPLCLSPQIYPPCLRLTMTQALHVPVSVYMVTLPSSFTGPHYTPGQRVWLLLKEMPLKSVFP
ncbi:unnamed protein product [Boreogadus saida]